MPPPKACAVKTMPLTSRDQFEFLPAVLEVQDTPPSPAGRVTLWVMLVLIAATLLWTYLSKIDIVVIATGKLIPTGHVKVIQPAEAATVKALHVQDGQTVRAGDVLVEFDTTATGADLARLEKERVNSLAHATRLASLIAALTPALSAAAAQRITPAFPVEVDQATAQRHQHLLTSELTEFAAQQLTLAQEQTRQHAERAALQEQFNKLTATLPLITQRTANLKALSDKQLAPQQDYLALEQARLESEHDWPHSSSNGRNSTPPSNKPRPAATACMPNANVPPRSS